MLGRLVYTAGEIILLSFLDHSCESSTLALVGALQSPGYISWEIVSVFLMSTQSLFVGNLMDCEKLVFRS